MRTIRWKPWFAISLLGALLAGCAGSKHDTGVLVVPYQLGNHRDCKSLGVVSVRAELDEGAQVKEVECDAGETRFNLLKPGSYDVVVYGLDESGVRVMDSLAKGPIPTEVVGGGTTVVVDPAVELTAAPAKLQLRWDLGFGSCQSTSISTFAVRAWRSDGSELLMQTDLACSMPGQGRGQYRAVPDKERGLSGDEVGEVDLQAKDGHGIAMGKPVTFTFDSPGPGGEVKLSLACTDSGCKGSGQPD